MNNDDATPTYAAREARFEATRVESPSNCGLNVIKIGRRAPEDRRVADSRCDI